MAAKVRTTSAGPAALLTEQVLDRAEALRAAEADLARLRQEAGGVRDELARLLAEEAADAYTKRRRRIEALEARVRELEGDGRFEAGALGRRQERLREQLFRDFIGRCGERVNRLRALWHGEAMDDRNAATDAMNWKGPLRDEGKVRFHLARADARRQAITVLNSLAESPDPEAEMERLIDQVSAADREASQCLASR
jgi:hypothetical protein